MNVLENAIPVTNFIAVIAIRLATIVAMQRVIPALKPAKTAISNFVQNVLPKMRGVKPVKRNQKKTPTPEQTTLRFTPTAWAKLLFLRDYGDTEVGGFGICPNHPLLVEDICLVQQTCSWASVEFYDESVADFFEDQVEAGLNPEQFARVWIHTHPGNSAQPSMTDEQTFARVFGSTNWAVMAILAKGGESYARLRLNGDARQDFEVPTEIDFTAEFPNSDQEDWEEDYLANVSEEISTLPPWEQEEIFEPASAEPLYDYSNFNEEDILDYQFDFAPRSF